MDILGPVRVPTPLAGDNSQRVATTAFVGGLSGGGAVMRNGIGAPSNSVGNSGDFYIDTANNRLYGPKAAGAWPGTYVNLIGPTGPAGSASGYFLVPSPGSGNITFDFTIYGMQEVVLSLSNQQLAITGDQIGRTYEIIIRQDATGSRTVQWFAGILWPGGITPILTTNAGKRDIFTFQKVASGTYLGFVAGQNL